MHLARLAFPILALAACTSTTAPEVVGTWGGTQASLVLAPSGGTLSYQCGAGTIDARWSLTPDGHFTAVGEHFFGGGPVPVQGRPPHPARYAGHVEGNVLTLTVTVTDLAQTLGPFRLERGGPAVAEVCV